MDQYAVGVIAFYLFSGMKEYPCKIPLYLTDDLDIYEHLQEAADQVEFSQPVWESYRFSSQLKKLVSGLLAFDESERLTAAQALASDVFCSRTTIFTRGGPSPILYRLEELLYINAFNTEELTPVNPIKVCLLHYLVQRVLPERALSYYKDIFRHIEALCSTRLDGYIRQSDVKRLPKCLRLIMLVIFSKFARALSAEEL